jgi:hypothetical protein
MPESSGHKHPLAPAAGTWPCIRRILPVTAKFARSSAINASRKSKNWN